MKRVLALCLLFTPFLFMACDDDDDDNGGNGMATFTVTIENVNPAYDYFSTDSLDAVAPGESLSFSFNAGQGHYLSFANMFVQTNDVFFAPEATGIALYDESGVALTGDITELIALWDAGTEENEAPGEGPNQAPRQEAPNTGTDEGGVVSLLSDVQDGFTYPAVNELIQVTVEHDGGTLFTVTIANLSDNSNLPSPVSPGVYVIHFTDQMPLFEVGEKASEGLEAIAEDGMSTTMFTDLSENSGLVTPFAPGAFFVGESNEIFMMSEAASAALEALAEDGDVAEYTDVFNTPEGETAVGPIGPGGAYTFTFEAEDGDRLSLATMFIQSNDWFVGLDQLSLFDSNGEPISGDVTEEALLYDAGTEVDEYAGAGANQAPRQAGPNTGEDEGGVVEEETSPSANVPEEVSTYLRITIEAQ
ncbi:spondin domain-containing protein [Algivirga pacifica]|uniref:Spondin domain-containing protein n=1 Tax=Algivirga pacifica TaxID=1162670 RepID=A0ABP9D1L2_9BACT